MSNDNAQTRVELLESDDYSKYILHGKHEILQVLHGLTGGRTLVSVHILPGNQSFLASILELTDEYLIIDASPDAEINRCIQEAEKLVCVGHVDKIRIQFALKDVTEVICRERSAFRATIPTELLRLQRREFVRLQTPFSMSVTCSIPLEKLNGGDDVAARVIDIGGGGLAIMVPPEGVPFSPGMIFENCILTLPELGTINVRLRVRNLFRLTNRNGIKMLRAGCEFVDLAPEVDSAIQRYISKSERARARN